MDDREDLVYQAKLAEQAERYDGERRPGRPRKAKGRGRERPQNGGWAGVGGAGAEEGGADKMATGSAPRAAEPGMGGPERAGGRGLGVARFGGRWQQKPGIKWRPRRASPGGEGGAAPASGVRQRDPASCGRFTSGAGPCRPPAPRSSALWGWGWFAADNAPRRPSGGDAGGARGRGWRFSFSPLAFRWRHGSLQRDSSHPVALPVVT